MVQNGMILFMKFFRVRLAEAGVSFQQLFDEFVIKTKASFKDARDLRDLLYEELGYDLTVSEPKHRQPAQLQQEEDEKAALKAALEAAQR